MKSSWVTSRLVRETIRPKRWTCSRCLHTQNQQNGTAAAAATPEIDIPASHASSTADQDDCTLRQILDDPRIGRSFSWTGRGHGKSEGLFRNKYLTSPSGFDAFAKATLGKCQKLVARILAADTTDDYRTMARDMDRLSDLLCRVIDLSDFVRATHPDRRFQEAATRAYSIMFEYMNQLNTTTGLNDQLKKAMSIPEVVSGWSEEEKAVANILMRDFSKSAIDLPESVRNDFVQVSNEIAEVGNDFLERTEPATKHLTFEKERMRGMDPSILRNAVSSGGNVHVPTMGGLAYYTLRQVEDPDVRRDMYMAHRTASKASIARLEKMLSARSRLAKISGYDTYADLTLSDKMAQTPEAVDQFLQALAKDTKPRVQADIQDLLEMKKSDARSDNFPNQLNAWDRDYYVSKLLANQFSRLRSSDTLSAYFSLGTVFQGLSRIFQRLYGVRFVPQETSPGETWHDDVKRLDVLDDSNNQVAVIYCDLFSRQGKSPNPAHFTLRCSREILPSELEEYAQDIGSVVSPLSDPIVAATDGMAHTKDPLTSSIHQLPTIALSCDFRPPTSSRGGRTPRQPTLLPFRDVQTLFHEMGHAIHSILGRTSFQNVAGTRCATDFAELPSILMEYFAFAPETLGLWARHWETDEALPYGLVRERLEVDRRMAAAENESQILLAMVDQAYHTIKQPHLDSTKIFHDIYNTHASIPEPTGTAWQGFFSHLYGYGATYYSYLFDRAIAARIWEVTFQSGATSTSREAGEKFKNEVLKWGGSRDPWACVAGAIDQPWLAEGGPKAMEEVGRWGVGTSKTT